MRLLLVDGTNVIMRCASVQTDVPREQVIASAGRMIRRAAEDPIRATHLIVAFDAAGQSFRKAIYPAYKAHRAERQADTERWAYDAAESFDAAGICVVAVPTFEADDLIATLAHRVTVGRENQHVDVHILSGDSDLLVLQSPQDPAIHCWQFARTAQGGAAVVERSREWITQKYGIDSPKQLTDYKALVGEAGDNVAGVKGIGPVKARALLREYGSIEHMNRYGILGAGAAWATQARDLLTLRADVPVAQIKPSACRIQRRSAAA